MPQKLMALFAMCLLTACGPSTKSAEVDLPEIPADLATCPRLQSISSRVGNSEVIGDDQIRILWAQDRTIAAKCNRKHQALVGYYSELRESLKPRK